MNSREALVWKADLAAAAARNLNAMVVGISMDLTLLGMFASHAITAFANFALTSGQPRVEW
jgi:hypothetical protein